MRNGSIPVTILTGPRGDGKSQFCRSLVVHDGVFGLFSPACESAPGLRYGIDAVILPADQRFPLARVTNLEQSTSRSRRQAASYTLVRPPAEDSFDQETIDNGIPLGAYTFSSEGIQQAGRTLLDAARAEATRLIVIDEIGPLELVHDQGFLEPLKTLLRGDSSIRRLPLLIVVRPSLVVPLCRLVAEERPGSTPETLSTRDFPRPNDARVIKSLT